MSDDIKIVNECSYCKTHIRGDKTGKHIVSHGICDDCFEREINMIKTLRKKKKNHSDT